MATFIDHEDLATFLRARKSPASWVAADFFQDNPNVAMTQRCVNLLESYCLRLAGSHEMRHVGLLLARQQPPHPTYRPPTDNARRSAVFRHVHSRYDEVLDEFPWWQPLTEAAAEHFNRHAPAWAAAIVRLFRGPREPVLDPGEEWYEVEFLVIKKVRVHAYDDIQAEQAAVARLTPKEREAVTKVRILDASGEPIDKDFWTPDKSSWMES